jgi:hypothetical protein
MVVDEMHLTPSAAYIQTIVTEVFKACLLGGADIITSVSELIRKIAA